MTARTKEALKLAQGYIGRLIRGLQMDNTSEAAKLLETLDEALAEESSGTEQPAPPPECQTEAEKTAFAFGWFKALETVREQPAIKQDLTPEQELAEAYRTELDKLSQRNYELRMENAKLKAQPQQKPVVSMDEMVNRFLAWPLPESVCTDPCTSWPGYSHSRIGTSLLTATEARQMLEHVLQGASPPASKPWVGLTDEEAIFLIENELLGRGDLIDAIEAKLKERNA